MNVRPITREEVYSYLGTPYNPPACSAEDEVSCDAFYSEWHEVRRGLLKVLERFGEDDPYGQKDFYLGDSAMLSRGIGVTFTNKTMLKPKILEAVAAYLATLPQDYSINITFQRDGEDDHDLFISRDSVLAELPADLWQKVVPAMWV